MEPNSMPAPGGPSPELRGPAFRGPEQQPTVGPATGEQAPIAPSPERAGSKMEQGAQNSGMQMPAVMPMPIQQVPAPQVPVAQPPVATDPIDAPDVANDVHVIEKEWVDKAKQIVQQTIDDPYMQNRNVSLLKADYMKKRYGKDIKVPEDTLPAKG